MAKIVMEFKDRKLYRPVLDGIVGAALRTNPDAVKVIVRCRTAASTVYAAIKEGYPVPVIIVEDPAYPENQAEGTAVDKE